MFRAATSESPTASFSRNNRASVPNRAAPPAVRTLPLLGAIDVRRDGRRQFARRGHPPVPMECERLRAAGPGVRGRCLPCERSLPEGCGALPEIFPWPVPSSQPEHHRCRRDGRDWPRRIAVLSATLQTPASRASNPVSGFLRRRDR